jgi:hypothetical protein
MLKSIVRSSNYVPCQSKQFKPRDELPKIYPIISSHSTDQLNSKNLTIDQKKALVLY